VPEKVEVPELGESGPEAHAESGAGSPLDPTAASLAAEAARRSPELTQEAAAYFRRQSRLIELQTEHLHEQRALNVSLLRLRRIGERAKVALQCVALLVALVFGIALIRIVGSALDDRDLVIEPFSVPPELAARGMTGQVVASQVLDRLGEINALSNSTRAPSSYAGNWHEQTKVEIPATGISLGELEKFFREWLGHETHITGEVTQTADGLAITVRTAEAPGHTVSAPGSELAALTLPAAESAFKATQPYRYSWYLRARNRRAEAMNVLEELAQSESARERAWAQAGIADMLNEEGDATGAARASAAAIAEDPRLALSYFNGAEAHYFLGDEQHTLELSRTGLSRLASDTTDLSPAAIISLRLGNSALVADLQGDFQLAASLNRTQIHGPSIEHWAELAPENTAYEEARNHDIAASVRATESHPISDAQAVANLASWGDASVAAYERFAALDDWLHAVEDMRVVIASASQWQAVAPIAVPLLLKPRLAYALARGGQQSEAESIAATLPKDCYRCVRARGWVATAAHDWQRADREFADAVLLAPSLPAAFTDWGASLLERGNSDGAIEKLSAALQRGPRSAEALEFWGEALLRKGNFAAAAEKFKAAARYAPRWGHLHLVWGEALMRAGRKPDAEAQLRDAQGMDLSTADAQRLQRGSAASVSQRVDGEVHAHAQPQAR
jgi:tetratricopeptide (TPR) repeat protein